jgi:hypothetical protein
MIIRCLEHPRQAGIELEYVPSLDCSKQRTKLEDEESLPTQPLSQYKYEQQMTSPQSLGGGKQCADNALEAVNTRAQANEARKRQNEATLADDDNIQSESSEKEKKVTKVVKDVKERRKCARSKVPKGFFEIDKIVTHREKDAETEYSIRWKGYDESHDEWRREQDITKAALDEYKEKLRWTRRDEVSRRRSLKSRRRRRIAR